MSSDQVRKARERLRRWRENPVGFIADEFGVDPDPWQRTALESFADPEQQRIAMKACKGPGKTAVLAWMCWNFLSTRPYPKIAATSISGDNLSDGLWTEMAKWQKRSKFLTREFAWNKTRISNVHDPENWWMSARQWSKSADRDKQADTLAGLHADYLLFVLDESGSIPDAVMAAAEAGLATGIETKLVQAGNPTMLEGPLYRACTSERNMWTVIEITGDPDNPERSSRISIKWAREQIEKYGADNPWVLVNVFGKFPPASINALLGPDEVRDAMKRHYKRPDFEFAARIIGLDVARFGDDSTVLFPRQGLVSFKPVVMRNAKTQDISARTAKGYKKWDADALNVDDTGGWSAGVQDMLEEAGYPLNAINFSGKAIDPRYYNKRAEMYFRLQEWIKKGGALPDDPDLVKELTAMTYTFKSGKLLLEDKDIIKEKLNGHSPDKADALALTFAVDVAPRYAFDGESMTTAHTVTPDDLEEGADHAGTIDDYDPYRDALD